MICAIERRLANEWSRRMVSNLHVSRRSNMGRGIITRKYRRMVSNLHVIRRWRGPTLWLALCTCLLQAVSSCTAKDEEKQKPTSVPATAQAEPAQAEASAQSLGLPANTKDMGKDPLGRRWFKVPSPSTSVAN